VSAMLPGRTLIMVGIGEKAVSRRDAEIAEIAGSSEASREPSPAFQS